MRLRELKQQVYRAWECLSSFNGALIQPENFKSEVRTFGDLRRSSTWEKAYCSFWARNISDSCLDAYELILIYFNYKPEDWDYELRHQVFDEFLATPDGLELLKLGLEQLFSADFTPQQREKAHGFFKLAQEQSARRGFSGQPVGFIRQLTGVS